jgi:hypothetical protein
VRNGLTDHGEGSAFGGHLRPRLQLSQRTVLVHMIGDTLRVCRVCGPLAPVGARPRQSAVEMTRRENGYRITGKRKSHGDLSAVPIALGNPALGGISTFPQRRLQAVSLQAEPSFACSHVSRIYLNEYSHTSLILATSSHAHPAPDLFAGTERVDRARGEVSDL